jgi:hypothetical protein
VSPAVGYRVLLATQQLGLRAAERLGVAARLSDSVSVAGLAILVLVNGLGLGALLFGLSNIPQALFVDSRPGAS